MGSYAGENEPKAGGGSGGGGSHVLLLPYPSQGHVHPMLQFGKRLAYHGLRPTLAVTRFILTTCAPDAAALQGLGGAGAVGLAAVSDGFDRGGFGECGDVTAYLSRLEAAGSETLGELLRDEAARGRRVRAVVYDAFLPWAQGAARRARRSTRRCAPWTCCTRTCWPPDTVPAGDGGAAAGAGGAAGPARTD